MLRRQTLWGEYFSGRRAGVKAGDLPRSIIRCWVGRAFLPVSSPYRLHRAWRPPWAMSIPSRAPLRTIWRNIVVAPLPSDSRRTLYAAMGWCCQTSADPARSARSLLRGETNRPFLPRNFSFILLPCDHGHRPVFIPFPPVDSTFPPPMGKVVPSIYRAAACFF